MELIRHRITARTLLQADSGRFLLLFTHWDPRSGLEPRWVCPGGGVETGESLELAASRELAEETGLLVEPGQFAQKVAEIAFEQIWVDERYETGLAHIFHLRIQNEFDVDRSMWTQDEHRDILAERWWDPMELNASGERVGPPGLIELMIELGSGN